MNFSVFEDDATLGQTANSRVVVLRGTTTVSQVFSPNLFDVQSWLANGLRNAGFDVVAVRMSPAAWVGYSNNLEIELNVFVWHTAEEARRNAIRAIDSVTANFGLNRVFSNTTLSVAADMMPAVPPRSSSPVPSSSPPSTYDQTGGQPVPNDGNGFWDKLGLGLGLSTPAAVAATGLVLLLILRK